MWTPHLRPALVLLTAFTALTGLAYPLAMTGIARGLLPETASGSLIERDGRIVGSRLIAQDFRGPGYFRPRPSHAGKGYDGASSGASNLGATSQQRYDALAERLDFWRSEVPGQPVPIELVSGSGSGLDPHLSPSAARFQVPRVARARGLTPAEVEALVDAQVGGRLLGFWGEPTVNVIELNLALDALTAGRRG
jgi:K+-transporting ATPase ATPase C chain